MLHWWTDGWLSFFKKTCHKNVLVLPNLMYFCIHHSHFIWYRTSYMQRNSEPSKTTNKNIFNGNFILGALCWSIFIWHSKNTKQRLTYIQALPHWQLVISENLAISGAVYFCSTQYNFFSKPFIFCVCLTEH